MKDFFIGIYEQLIILLLVLYLIGGLFISYNISTLWNYGNLHLGIFLLGLVITFISAAVTFGLIFIQLQNNALLKDIKANTNQNHILKDIKKIIEKNITKKI